MQGRAPQAHPIGVSARKGHKQVRRSSSLLLVWTALAVLGTRNTEKAVILLEPSKFPLAQDTSPTLFYALFCKPSFPLLKGRVTLFCWAQDTWLLIVFTATQQGTISIENYFLFPAWFILKTHHGKISHPHFPTWLNPSPASPASPTPHPQAPNSFHCHSMPETVTYNKQSLAFSCLELSRSTWIL